MDPHVDPDDGLDAEGGSRLDVPAEPVADEFDEDEDEDDMADPKLVVKEFGEHKLMERVQKALFEQLQREYDRVTVEKHELEGELRKVRNEKEQVGVELYGNQQQLARLQMALENLHNQFHSLTESRSQEEGVLEECKARHASLKATHAEKQKALLKAQAELDALNETLMQVEKYNEEMKSEIAITRRATYKAESNVQDLEKQKQSQDLYIDSLNSQIKSLNEQIAMHEAQIEVQQTQTEEAKKILSETTGEMELIAFEKKQLMQQWKASLINLTKRDEAVAAATKQLDHAKTELQDMASEIIGLKREIIAAQSKNEQLMGVRDRLSKEEQQLEEQTSKIMQERDELAERYQMLHKSMAQTDDEEKKVDVEKQELEKSIESLIQNIQVVNRERQKLELSILDKANEKVTVAKAVKNYMKSMKELKTRIHDREIEATGVENELSRIRVDSLNTEAHNVQLREMLEKEVKELADKDKLIEKYQMEIRQRNDEIEKKMYRVDRLNNKYEKMVEAQGGNQEEPLLGPLEATIKSLGKEIESVGEENASLQKDWLTSQTALVHTTADTEAIVEKNSELRARIAILSEKKLRATKETVVLQAEIRRLDAGMEAMHGDMARLNELIGKNKDLETELERSNSVKEMEFVEELKELEHASIDMERRLAEVKERKAVILDEIMEAERQLLLWEKKIQLEKETQAALDPEVGMSEIKAMEKEIHRMELRRNTLRTEKEKILVEIERAVHKREAMAIRQLGKKKGAKTAGSDPTRASLSKKLSALKKEVKTTATATAEYMAAIEQSKQELQHTTERLEERTTIYGELEQEANATQADINQQLYDKQRQAEIVGRRERLLERYQELERGKIDEVDQTEMPLVEDKVSRSSEEVGRVKSLIGSLRSKFGHLDEVLGRVLQLAEADSP